MDDRTGQDPQSLVDMATLAQRCSQARAWRYGVYLAMGLVMMTLIGSSLYVKHAQRPTSPTVTSTEQALTATDCGIRTLAAPKNQWIFRTFFDPACWALLIKQNQECQIQTTMSYVAGGNTGEMFFVFTCPPTPAAQ